MSEPILLQTTFMLKKETPEDIKKIILYCFTDYYTKYFPEKTPSDDVIYNLYDKYPEISDIYRNDGYHNIQLQRCNLSDMYLFDDDNKETNKDIGVSIISLPRSFKYVDKFFAFMKPYIYSHVPTLGIATLDYNNVCYIYSIIDDEIYCKDIAIKDKNNAELVK